jgi:hypothetical protein
LQESVPIRSILRQKKVSALFSAGLLLVAAALGACTDSTTETTEMRPTRRLSACVVDAYLTVNTYGAIETSIDWRGNAIDCKGMRRPRGRGARLRFSGKLGEGDQSGQRTIAFILSLPDLKEGKIAHELLTGVTLIEENEGRFFGTQEAKVCWSDIKQQTPLLDTMGNAIPGRYIISGLSYCVAPIPELNGTSSVTLSDLQFRGQLDWGD